MILHDQTRLSPCFRLEGTCHFCEEVPRGIAEDFKAQLATNDVVATLPQDTTGQLFEGELVQRHSGVPEKCGINGPECMAVFVGKVSENYEYH